MTMSKIKVLNANRCIAVFMAMLMMILSLSYTNYNHTDAATKTRTYLIHDYSSTNLSSYYEYTLTTGSNTTKTVLGTNNMVSDNETSVVRIDGSGGTGFIVDDNVIATAAHCVYDRTHNQFLNFKISIIDNNNIIKTISPKYVHINKQFKTNSNNNHLYDYALIYVEEDLSDYGKIYLGVAMDSYINKKGEVTVSGFPQEYPDGYKDLNWGIRFKSSGNLVAHNDNSSYILKYNADTSGGDSGGPVYVEEGLIVNGQLKHYRTAIGIHTIGGTYDNGGVKITPEIFKFYMSNPNITV